MLTIAFGAACLLLFVAATLTAADLLRRVPSRQAAAQFSRLMHGLLLFCLVLPSVLAGVQPGWFALDGLVGLTPLGMPLLRLPVGLLLGISGAVLMRAAAQALRTQATMPPDAVVRTAVYARSRNPMALGSYLSALGLSLLLGSQLLVWYVLLGLIPAHLLYLKLFEERELSLRFAADYDAYRRRVPFLLPRRSAE